jgi:tripartite-type tricarboxylate transporter receptor subunit TctC
MNARLAWTLLAGAVALAAIPSAAMAQKFPSKDVVVVVPFTPGGSNDTMGRLIADGLAKEWGSSVVVENKPGAGSAIGTAYVAQAKPDGHTLLVVSGTFTTNAAVQTNLPFDPIKDVKPVAMVAQGQMVVTVSPTTGIKTVKELIEAAKAKPMFYATTGVGSSTQFGAELFNDAAGIQMKPVHYKGGTDAIVDMIGGRVQMYVGTLTQVLPTVTGNQITAVAVTGRERAANLPDVPTVGEAGLKGAEVQNWWGVFTTGGTPDDVVAKINAAVNKVVQSPEATKFLAGQGAAASPMSPLEFAAHVNSELEKYKAVAQKSGIKAE